MTERHHAPLKECFQKSKHYNDMVTEVNAIAEGCKQGKDVAVQNITYQTSFFTQVCVCQWTTHKDSSNWLSRYHTSVLLCLLETGGGGYSKMKVTGMCLPENEDRGAFGEGFCRRKGVIGCEISKKWVFFGVNFPK